MLFVIKQEVLPTKGMAPPTFHTFRANAFWVFSKMAERQDGNHVKFPHCGDDIRSKSLPWGHHVRSKSLPWGQRSRSKSRGQPDPPPPRA